MVKTRQQNTTSEAIHNSTKFSKEQNDLKIKESQEFAACLASGQFFIILISWLELFFNRGRNEKSLLFHGS